MAMNAEEYKNLVLLKENLSKLKHTRLITDSSFRKLYGAMKDHCDNTRRSTGSPQRVRPSSAFSGGKNDNIMEKSLTSVFVLLSHMLVELSRSREISKSKLQQVQRWFVHQLPGVYDNLAEPPILFQPDNPKAQISASFLKPDAVQPTKPSPQFFEESPFQSPRIMNTVKTAMRPVETASQALINNNELFRRRPNSAVVVDSLKKKVFPDEEAISELQFASRRGMPFAHRYTAHGGGERPEVAILTGIQKMLVENCQGTTEMSEMEVVTSGLDTRLVDQVAAELEERRERIVDAPSRGFRQPVVAVEPNTTIVPISNAMNNSTAPPSTPRSQSRVIDVRKAGSLLVIPQGSETSQEQEDSVKKLVRATTPGNNKHDEVNIRSTPIPPPEPEVRPESTQLTVNNFNWGNKSRVVSAPPVLSAKAQPKNSASASARMQRQRRELHQASRKSAGFQSQNSKTKPENDLSNVLSVQFLMQSRDRTPNRFSMRDHFKMMRQMSASSQRAATTSPQYFSFCASASKKDSEETDTLDFDLSARTTSSTASKRRPQSAAPNSYGSHIVNLVSEVDSAMELAKILQKELAEYQSADSNRPQKLAENLKYVGPSVSTFRACRTIDHDANFDKADYERRAAVLIQRVYRGFSTRRYINSIIGVLSQIDRALQGLLPASVTQPTRWQTEAKLYRRIIERIVIHRLEAREKAEKYPRRIKKPSISFSLENFFKYLEVKLVVATEFRRRAIGGTIEREELPGVLNRLSVSASQEKVDVILKEQFGMRYRYHTRPLPAADFLDLFWWLQPPAGTPPPPRPLTPQVVTSEPTTTDSITESPPPYAEKADGQNHMKTIIDIPALWSTNKSKTRPKSAVSPSNTRSVSFATKTNMSPASSRPTTVNRQGKSSSLVSTRPTTSTSSRPKTLYARRK